MMISCVVVVVVVSEKSRIERWRKLTKSLRSEEENVYICKIITMTQNVLCCLYTLTLKAGNYAVILPSTPFAQESRVFALYLALLALVR